MNKLRKYKKYSKLGFSHFYKKNYKKSINSYLRCINIIDNNEVIYKNIAYSYYYLFNDKCALKYIDKSLNVSCGYYEAIKLKGKILEGLGEKEEAKVWFDKIKLLDIKYSNIDLDYFINNNYKHE